MGRDHFRRVSELLCENVRQTIVIILILKGYYSLKILYVDTAYSGHHFKYFKSLVSNIDLGEKVAVYPNKAPLDNIIRYHLEGDFKRFSIIKYIIWIVTVYRIVKNEKPDIIHFLYGDFFYRYFGLLLWVFKKQKVIITFHHVKKSKIRDISLKHICKNVTKAVVHTRKLKLDLNGIGIYNVEHIEYPVFIDKKIKEKIPDDIILDKCKNAKILLSLGATRYDKGLDILLEALKNVEIDFRLIIAGTESDIKLDQIKELTDSYKDKVFIHMDYLSESEYIGLIQMSDIIVLPYRKVFDGASGPLTEAVYFSKIIIGPNHGSLGQIISDNCLGSTFESENIFDLAESIKKELTQPMLLSNKYFEYQHSLLESNFVSQYEKNYKLLVE